MRCIINDIFTYYLIPVILIAGWGLDLLFGDPIRLPHPVVGMGKWITFGEKHLNKGTYKMAKGAFFALTSIILTFTITFLLLWVLKCQKQPVFYYSSVILQIILVYFCLAGTTLRKEVKMVFKALDRSLDDGRQQVARIVGRDTSELTEQEVRTAALETLAENLSDGVVAPVFWFAILGVPGMMAYKMVNTLDSMIGYRNERYRLFGCWAAHIDDIANYLPARITAFLITIAGWIVTKVKRLKAEHPRSLWQQFQFVCHYGPMHASPNSGWPEAALAAVLDCRFGGSHSYFGEEFYKPYIGDNPRNLDTNDMVTSNRTSFIAEAASIIITIAILTLIIVSID